MRRRVNHLGARARRGGAHLAALAALSVLLPNCGASTKQSDDERLASGLFVAIASDFRGYHSWDSFDVTDKADLAGIHDGSTVTEYINKLPPSGSDAFPLGTIIVKEATGGTNDHEIFSMVKRGGNLNKVASGWEWFDLLPVDDGRDSVTIKWHGVGPPSGETYGGDADSGCNACHRDCGNDGVCANALNLKNF
jgi:hypothetical protein